MDPTARLQLAEHVRAACVAAAQAGYEDAAMAGLCGEGALEAAIGAIQQLDVAKLAAPHAAEEQGAQRER